LKFSFDENEMLSETMVASHYLFFVLLLVLLFLLALVVNNILSMYFIVRSRKMSGRKHSSQEKAMVVRSTLVSLSNVVSWLVVVPVAGMGLFGYQLQSLTIAWVAIVGLPVNSVLNPILYTFSTKSFRKYMVTK